MPPPPSPPPIELIRAPTPAPVLLPVPGPRPRPPLPCSRPAPVLLRRPVTGTLAPALESLDSAAADAATTTPLAVTGSYRRSPLPAHWPPPCWIPVSLRRSDALAPRQAAAHLECSLLAHGRAHVARPASPPERCRQSSGGVLHRPRAPAVLRHHPRLVGRRLVAGAPFLRSGLQGCTPIRLLWYSCNLQFGTFLSCLTP